MSLLHIVAAAAFFAAFTPVFGPKGLPPAVVERLNAEVTKVLQLKQTAEQA